MNVDLKRMAERAARGDREAFRTVVQETQDRLFRLAARITGSTSDAEDVLQDAYLKAHDALTSGRFDGRSSVATWLYRIVTNTAIDCLRRRDRRKGDTLADEPADPTCEASPEARIALRELAGWLDELPAEQRAALVLRVVEGLTTPEVAQILGCTEEAAEQRLVRARATLRKRRDADE